MRHKRKKGPLGGIAICAGVAILIVLLSPIRYLLYILSIISIAIGVLIICCQ